MEAVCEVGRASGDSTCTGVRGACTGYSTQKPPPPALHSTLTAAPLAVRTPRRFGLLPAGAEGGGASGDGCDTCCLTEPVCGDGHAAAEAGAPSTQPPHPPHSTLVSAPHLPLVPARHFVQPLHHPQLVACYSLVRAVQVLFDQHIDRVLVGHACTNNMCGAVF